MPVDIYFEKGYAVMPTINQNKTVKLTVIGAMSALATVIYMLLPEIPLVPGVEYLKMDLSDVPALLTAITLGPWSGIAVEVIKNIIHLFRTTTFGIGELMNVGIGSVIMAALYGFSRLFSRLFRRHALSPAVYYSASVSAIACTILAGWLLNGALTPLYFRLVGIPITTASILTGVWGSTLLNAIKASLNLLPLYPLYRAVARLFENGFSGQAE